MKGKFITLEGCEGVGKSTQLKLLSSYLESRKIKAVYTREPGGTPIAEDIREIILSGNNSTMSDRAELMLYFASRAQHVAEKIIPAIKSGKLVVCDRFVDSTIAYQGYGRGMDRGVIDMINNYCLNGLNIDLTLLFDLDPIEGFKRKGGADSADRLENAGMDFHRRVYEGFRVIATASPDRVCLIDASGTPQQIHEQIVAILINKQIIPRR